ncbi:ras gtpase-activating protein [Anaeramoeba flamelloides]|uniref:Ras gtpase-activating protein n=1 Tax=Anaeramoeba flamelloides TaxID=1746091 RepID=A0AAV7ZB40_9EUKA|nr:ras gtpase-activating protein [Anaeramoeba flamelloides]
MQKLVRSIELPQETQRSLFRLKFNSNAKVLAVNSEEDVKRLDSVELLRRWVVYQAKKQNPNTEIRNLGENLKDCSVLANLLETLEPGIGFTTVCDSNDLNDRAISFVQILVGSGYKEEIIDPTFITSGDQIEIIKFLTKLFIWKPNFPVETKKTFGTSSGGYSRNIQDILSRVRTGGNNNSTPNTVPKTSSSYEDLLKSFRKETSKPLNFNNNNNTTSSSSISTTTTTTTTLEKETKPEIKTNSYNSNDPLSQILGKKTDEPKTRSSPLDFLNENSTNTTNTNTNTSTNMSNNMNNNINTGTNTTNDDIDKLLKGGSTLDDYESLLTTDHSDLLKDYGNDYGSTLDDLEKEITGQNTIDIDKFLQEGNNSSSLNDDLFNYLKGSETSTTATTTTTNNNNFNNNLQETLQTSTTQTTTTNLNETLLNNSSHNMDNNTNNFGIESKLQINSNELNNFINPKIQLENSNNNNNTNTSNSNLNFINNELNNNLKVEDENKTNSITEEISSNLLLDTKIENNLNETTSTLPFIDLEEQIKRVSFNSVFQRKNFNRAIKNAEKCINKEDQQKNENESFDSESISQRTNELMRQKEANLKLKLRQQKSMDLMTKLKENLDKIGIVKNNLTRQWNFRDRLSSKVGSLSQFKEEETQNIEEADFAQFLDFLKNVSKLNNSYITFRRKLKNFFHLLVDILPTDKYNNFLMEIFCNSPVILSKNIDKYHHENERVLMKSIFDLLKLNNLIDKEILPFKKMKKLLFSINPMKPKEYLRMKKKVTSLLKRENIVDLNAQDNCKLKRSFDLLFNLSTYSAYFKKKLTFQIIKKILLANKLIPDPSESTEEENNQMNEFSQIDNLNNPNSNNLKKNKKKKKIGIETPIYKQIYSVLDKFLSGKISQSLTIETLIRFIYGLSLGSPLELAQKCYKESSKYAIGKTLQCLVKEILPEENLQKIENTLNIYKTESLPLFENCIQRSIQVANDLLRQKELEYFTAAFDYENSKEFMEPLVATIFQFLEVLGLSLQFVWLSITQEVSRTMSVLSFFYENDLASVMIREYTKYHGKKYLKYILSDLVEKLIHSGLDFEIDPQKLSQSNNLQNLQNNQKNVEIFFLGIITSIFESEPYIPKDFRLLASHLKSELLSRFPDTVKTTLGGLFFRNFVCKGVMDPKEFGITAEIPQQQYQNGLRILASVIENVSAGKLFTNNEKDLLFMNETISSKFSQRSEFIEKLSDDQGIDISEIITNFMNIANNSKYDADILIDDYNSHLLLQLDPRDVNNSTRISMELTIVSGKVDQIKKDTNNNAIISTCQLFRAYNQFHYLQKDLLLIKRFFDRIEAQFEHAVEQKKILILKEQQLKEEISIEEANKPTITLVDDLKNEMKKLWQDNFEEETSIQEWIQYGKKNQKIKWSKKFLMLKNNLLAMFDHTPKSSETVPELLIKITSKSRIQQINSLKKKNVFTIIQAFGSLNHYFTCQNPISLKNWINQASLAKKF